MLNAYPLPTPGFQQGTSNFITSFPHYSNTRKDTFKVDYMINDKERLSFRGTHIPWTFQLSDEGTFGLFQALWSRPNRTAAIKPYEHSSPRP